MKILKVSLLPLFAILLTLSLALMPAVSEAAGPTPLTVTPVLSDSLTADEIADLQFMREEEKLARDVYITLYDMWGMRLFQNISQSEQSHMDAVGMLLERYDIADPVGENGVGEFTNPALQALYDELMKTGSESLAAALQVGGAIEEIDILDLEKAVAETEPADILQVYANLLAGSGNHLRAFSSTFLRQTGDEYEPQYMDSAVYDEIVEATGAMQGRSGMAGKRGPATSRR